MNLTHSAEQTCMFAYRCHAKRFCVVVQVDDAVVGFVGCQCLLILLVNYTRCFKTP